MSDEGSAPAWRADSAVVVRSGIGPAPVLVLSVLAAAVLAWTCLVVHNVADLPEQNLLSSESLVPGVVWLLALGLCAVPQTRRAGTRALLAWGTINLVGGALSVLPLPFLPFSPEQTARHYAFHALYAAGQIPVIVLAAASLRRSAC